MCGAARACRRRVGCQVRCCSQRDPAGGHIQAGAPNRDATGGERWYARVLWCNQHAACARKGLCPYLSHCCCGRFCTAGVLGQQQPVLNFCERCAVHVAAWRRLHACHLQLLHPLPRSHAPHTPLPAGANNYLGLSNHPAVVAAAHEALDSHGFGLSSVRFICGTQVCARRRAVKGQVWLWGGGLAAQVLDLLLLRCVRRTCTSSWRRASQRFMGRTTRSCTQAALTPTQVRRASCRRTLNAERMHACVCTVLPTLRMHACAPACLSAGPRPV